MKARIYRTHRLWDEDKELENKLAENSIPFQKIYESEYEEYYYCLNINCLEELLGLQRIFEYRLIIQEDKMLTNDKEEKLLDIEVYNTYRE